MQWINSSDSHILEPEGLFEKALGKRFKDTPRYVDGYKGVKAKFYFTGYEYIRIDEIVEGGSDPAKQALQDELIRASKDPYVRLKCLDRDGVWAEILNSTWMLYTMRAPDDRMVEACCQVYNDWIAEHASADPRRLYGTAMIHMADVGWAAKELKRVAKKGLRSVLINCDTRPDWPLYQEKQYDRFWAAAQEADMPVTLHIITGNVKDLFTFHGDERKKIPGETIKLLQEAGPVVANEFIFGGIMDRFPKLKIVCSEFEVSWLPYWMFRVHQLQHALGPAMHIKLPKKPVETYYRRIFHGLVDDSEFKLVWKKLPLKNIAWGSDFPHARCTYPNSQKVVKQVFKGLPQKVVDDLTYYNVAEYYNMTLPKSREIKKNGLKLAAE